MLHSLTTDKRIHRQLRGFGEKLPHFLDFVRSQGPDFVHNTLKAPVFPGSLLADERDLEKQSAQEGQTARRSIAMKRNASQDSNNSRVKSPQQRINSSTHSQFESKKMSAINTNFGKSPTLELPSEMNKSMGSFSVN